MSTPGRKISLRSCKGCGTKIVNNVTRAINHNDICPELWRKKLWTKPGQTLLTETIATIPKPEAEELLQTVGRAMYALNLPFSMADHPMWRSMLTGLRTGFRPPNRRVIRGRVLDAVYDQEVKKWCADLMGEMVDMSCDGWSGPAGQPVLGVTVGDQLLESFETLGRTRASTWLASWTRL
jgi:hypothetical protein